MESASERDRFVAKYGNGSVKVLPPAVLNGKEDNAIGTDYLEGQVCGSVPCSITFPNSRAGKLHDKETRCALGITVILNWFFTDVRSM